MDITKYPGFFIYCTFGKTRPETKDLCNGAYRDFARTLHHVDEQKRKDLKAFVAEKMATELPGLLKHKEKDKGSPEEFDVLHKAICDCIRNRARKADIPLTYGQVQKWVNMTVKNRIILKGIAWCDVSPHLHVPIDGRIIEAAEEYSVEISNKSWSKIDDYGDYLVFQNAIRKAVNDKGGGISPLQWEYGAWLEYDEKQLKIQKERGFE